jgi:hypothetical protein
MSTELVEVQNAVAQMNKVEAGLEALRKEYRGVLYPVATAAGMEAAKLARRLIREPRFEVEKIRKAAKAPILALGKKLDSEAQRITRELTLIEAPIDMQITQEEDRIAAEKQARIDAEMARIREIQMRIEDIRNAPALCAAREPDAISVHIFDIQGTVIDASFAEFEQEASKAKDTTLAALRGLHAAAVAREVENARIAAERAELAKLRREARNAEAVRIAGEHRAQREAFEREQAEARERQAAEDRRIAEDRAKLQREQEALRKANELPPARKNVHNPGREAIAEVVSHFYSVEASTAMRWLREIDWEAVSA